MELYSDEIMNKLKNSIIKVNILDYEKDFMNMVNNNHNHESTRKNPRTFEKIKSDSGSGFGAEIALQNTGYFTSYAPITEGAIGITYAQRKTDLLCEGKKTEVKTMSSKYSDWYINEHQYRSIQKSAPLNNNFLVLSVNYNDFPEYTYKTKFLIDSTSIMKYIITNWGGPSPYKFAHQKAIKDNICIELTE